MGFSWALYFCQKMVESCVRLAGFSADALLMDHHQALAMTRDSVCFGLYVDGVCAVGCNRPKVLAALEAVKATLDAAGLHVLRLRLMHPSKFSQVFNCFAYLAIVTWPEVCCASKTSYWRPGGQINWAHHLELLAASSCLVFHQCWVLFCTYFRTPKRAVMARGRPGIPMDRVTTAAFHLQPCQSLVTVGLCYRCFWWSTWGLWSYASLV